MKLFIKALLKEFSGNFLLGIVLFSLFFFFGESNRLLELALLVSGEQALVFLSAIGRLYFRYWMSMLGFILPMALIFGIVLTLARLREDRELLALETLGINLNRWLYALMAAIGCFFLLVQIPLVGRYMPQARYQLKRFAFESRASLQNFKLEAGSWNDLGSAHIFASKVSGSELEGVTLYVRQKSQNGKDGTVYRIVGKTARYELVPEDAGPLHLRLKFYSGVLDFPSRQNPEDVTSSEFETLENYVPLAVGGQFVRSWREHTSRELSQMLSKPADFGLTQTQIGEMRFEYHTRLNLVAACLVLALIGTYASRRFTRLTRGFGFGLVLAILAVYWITMVFAASIRMPYLANLLFTVLALATLSLPYK